MQKFKLVSAIVAMTIILSGCTGAVLRAGMTDNVTYKEAKGTISGIEAGFGRVFVYVPKGDPDIFNTMGTMDFVSFDKVIYRFGGASYFPLDLEARLYQVTATEVVKTGFASNKKQYGTFAMEVSVPEGGVIYLKIASQKARVYTLEVVSKSIAESEMSDLSLWTNSTTTMKIE